MEVFALPDVLQHYAQFRGEIAGILDPRCYTIEWLDEQIWSGKFQLWASPEAVLITKVRTYPAGARDCHAMIAAGDLKAITDLRARAEDWARGEGVEFASCASRPGWARILERFGYRLFQTECRKEL